MMSENNMEETKIQVENRIPDQHLSLDEDPPSSCRKVRMRFRPKLQSTKSFPPYSQCIGGLGEDEDSGSDSESKLAHQPSDSTINMDGSQAVESIERKEEFESHRKCAMEEVKAKWRTRRRERLGGSFDTERLESAKWSIKKRVDEPEEEKNFDNDKMEGEEWKRCVGGKRDKEDEVRKRPSLLAVQREDEEGSRETPEAEEMPGITEGSSPQQWTSPHPILSKLLHSSSSSSCSSISLSTEESDDVFSEGEDAISKRKTLRKCRSWKTYLTMMHWSLRRQSSWVQLAGHQGMSGNFQLGDSGEILKLYSGVEERCLENLMKDSLRAFVPRYHGVVTRGEDCYIRLDDLLSGLKRPVIMDCKMGVRTFQEEELLKARTRASLRTDMYQKMVKMDPSAPSAEEHAQKAVTKLRYLQWRDMTSSTSTLGFRIEGIMMEDGNVQRDFRKTLTITQATEVLLYFSRCHLDILKAYHSRLLALSEALKTSLFFRTHEVIGSSLLFVHDLSSKASVWMIDFGKTTPVPDSIELLHDVQWVEGNREDGYLIGLTSLIASLGQAITVASWQQQDSCEGEKNVT
ncbi:inositol-trisphosphate 3-kinase B-like isoform X2 [Xyrichtys novacula]|uniref:Kinase n=1 Tax=Xyrichtys novacula TaxID=13765 RepID=A0AAV1FBG4_XYRNO|nr:inositol-trisphosphate 3-kinase B-like isoform X2 [Xyrichtys novacula]